MILFQDRPDFRLDFFSSKSLLVSMARAKSSDLALLALLEMEPDIRQIQSIGMVLQALAQTADAIEPLALVVLARSLNHSAGQIEAAWRRGMPRSDDVSVQ